MRNTFYTVRNHRHKQVTAGSEPEHGRQDVSTDKVENTVTDMDCSVVRHKAYKVYQIIINIQLVQCGDKMLMPYLKVLHLFHVSCSWFFD